MSIRELNLKKKIGLLITSAVIVIGCAAWFILYYAERNDAIEYTENMLASNLEVLAKDAESKGLDGVNMDASVWSQFHPQGRVTVISLNGDVVTDTKVDPKGLENHYTRGEVMQAFADGAGKELRYSKTLRQWQIYLAQRVILPGTPGTAYVIRMSYPVSELSGLAKNISIPFFKYFFIIIILVWGGTYLILKIIMKPLHELTEAAAEITAGKQMRFPITGDAETQTLSNTLNEMQDTLRAATGEAGERKAELSQLVGALPIGVILVDDDNKIRYINSEAARICGADGMPARGSSVQLLLPSQELCAMLDAEDARREIKLFGGETLVIEALTRRLPRGRLLVLLDLTEKARIEEIKHEFFIDAGHEFQTPLTIIRTGLDLLKGSPEMAQPQNKEDADMISDLIRQQERISGLVDDLMLLVRLDAEPAAKKTEAVDIAALIEEIKEDMQRIPSSKTLDIRVSQLTHDSSVTASRDDLYRALLNIIDNARKYSQSADGKEAKIHITINEEDGFIVVKVEDNGPGIPLTERKLVFERFRRGDSHRARADKSGGGYGLGLSIAKRVIERHKGTLDLGDSELGGASFVVRLPKHQLDKSGGVS